MRLPVSGGVENGELPVLQNLSLGARVLETDAVADA